MGFSEFQRINRQLSNHLGLGVNYEDGEDEDFEEEDEEEDESDEELRSAREEQRRQSDAALIRNRWKQAGKKVRLFSRFVKATEANQMSFLESFVRKGCYSVSGRVLNCSCETAFVYAALGMDRPSWHVLFLAGVPALFTGALISHTIKFGLTQLYEKRQKKKEGPRKPLFRVLASVSQFVFHALVTYPLEVGFTRSVVLGQSFVTSMTSLSISTAWNGVSSYFAQEVVEGGMSLVYELLVDDEKDTLFSWIGFMTARFVASVPFVVIHQNIAASCPESLWPSSQFGFWEMGASIVQGKGIRGLFQGMGTMGLLLPPMFGVYVLSQILTHKILGKTKREIYEEQVEKVREELELRTKTVMLLNRGHLETIVKMAAKRYRILILVVVNASRDSKLAIEAAATFAKGITDATFVIGDVVKIPALRNLNRDVRLPFFLPIIQASVEGNQATAYRPEINDHVFQRLNSVVNEEKKKLAQQRLS